MKQTTIDAVKALGKYVDLSYRDCIYCLMGNQNSSKRQHIMSVLHGKKIPKAKCGVSVLQKEFLELSNAQGNCLAVKLNNFSEWAQGVDKL